MLEVSPDLGMSHHYRVCEFGGDDCVQAESIVDRTVYRYAGSLIVNFKSRYTKFSALCTLPRLSFDLWPAAHSNGAYFNLSEVHEFSQRILGNFTRGS